MQSGYDELADGSYDGAVLTTTRRRSSLPRDLSERGIPHVLVNRTLDDPESPSCEVDNAAGARAVAALLADLGHWRIGSIQGPVETSTGRDRALALRLGLRNAGISLPRSLVRRVSFTHDAGYSAAHELLAHDERPTAIACGNDVIALGVLSAARSLALRVPEDLTVIGFDDIPAAAWALADLTTVHCDLRMLAETAVELLLAEMRSPGQVPIVHRQAVRLVLRATHGPATIRSTA